ncbi:MAG: hypothetical protein ACQEQS_11050, partial [Thermodesulfobacteriota bacterium]
MKKITLPVVKTTGYMTLPFQGIHAKESFQVLFLLITWFISLPSLGVSSNFPKPEAWKSAKRREKSRLNDVLPLEIVAKIIFKIFKLILSYLFRLR